MTKVTARVVGGVVVLTGALVVSGCSTIKVKTGYDPAADFGSYRTFSVAAGEQATAPLVRRLVEGEVTRNLESKGLKRVAADADLVVHMIGGLGEMDRLDPVTTTQHGYGWGGGTVGYESLSSWGIALEEQVPIGTLVVDMVDRGQNRGVWRGAARGPLTGNPEADIERIKKVVAKLMAGYPPRTR